MTSPTTRLAEIAERHGRATKGEWRSYSEHLSGGKYWCVTAPDLEEYIVDGIHEEYNGEADSAFIAHAHQDIPYLLARDAVAQARSREDAEIMRRAASGVESHNMVEWPGEAGVSLRCNICGAPDDIELGPKHTEQCFVTKLRARADELEGRTGDSRIRKTRTSHRHQARQT